MATNPPPGVPAQPAQPSSAPPVTPALGAQVVTPDERQWGMLAHLSALIAWLLGSLSFVGPLVIFLLKRNESRFVEYHAREALNFNISILIYFWASILITAATCGFGAFLPLGVAIFAIVMTVIAGLKANNGELYEYPLSIRLVK